MDALRALWRQKGFETHISHYSGDAHPSILFQGVKFRLSIILQNISSSPTIYSTHFQRWLSKARDNLFSLIKYIRIEPSFIRLGLIPKIGSEQHYSILKKIFAEKRVIEMDVVKSSGFLVYSHRIIAHFVKAVDLNSSLFYSWFVAYSDVYHCGRELILNFPCDINKLSNRFSKDLCRVKDRLMHDLQHNSVRRSIPYKKTGLVEYDEFYPRKSKPIIDEIDRILAQHYGFTPEELDFIINYDIKYRMGQNYGDEEGEE
jgi:hypothetical protein